MQPNNGAARDSIPFLLHFFITTNTILSVTNNSIKTIFQKKIWPNDKKVVLLQPNFDGKGYEMMTQ